MKVSNYFLFMLGLALCFVFLQPSTVEAQTGSLQVTINPPAVRDAGAQWRVVLAEFPGEIFGPWRNSGDTEPMITAGDYIIEFSDVEDWIKPVNQVVNIVAGVNLSLEGLYRQPHEEGGSIQVVIEPEGARNDGARWRITGTTDWLESGDTIRGLLPGTHTIEFSLISGWTTPERQTLTVETGLTTHANAVYIKSETQTGSLQIILRPQEAREAGAQWRRAGQTEWHDSGVVEENIPVGVYDIEFKSISGWIKPQSQLVTIAQDDLITIAADYKPFQDTGTLTVIIDPEGARDAGAKWRINMEVVKEDERGTRTDYVIGEWRGSGDTEVNIQPGVHLVEFNDIIGWARPPNQSVTVQANRNTTLRVSYLQSGTLSVFLEPADARVGGAGWRVASIIPDLDKFPSGWYDEDITTLFGLRPGTHTIEFNSIPGWVKPADQTVTIYSGKTTFLTGRYVLSTEEGYLRVYLEPSPAPHLGARWRRVGTDIWLHSGEMERGFPEGTYTVEFKPVPGWAVPGNKAVTIHRGNPPANIVGVYSSPQTTVRVMNWLESIYPSVLPLSGMQVHTPDDWYIRYYPGMNTYLGSCGERLYYYAPSIEDVVHDFGGLEIWLPSAIEAGF